MFDGIESMYHISNSLCWGPYMIGCLSWAAFLLSIFLYFLSF